MKIAVVGAGKLGMRVTNALLGGDHAVTVIDKNEQTLQKLGTQMDVMTVTADGKDISVLRDIHISSFDFLLASTDSDEKNIIIASFAKKMGCSHDKTYTRIFSVSQHRVRDLLQYVLFPTNAPRRLSLSS